MLEATIFASCAIGGLASAWSFSRGHIHGSYKVICSYMVHFRSESDNQPLPELLN